RNTRSALQTRQGAIVHLNSLSCKTMRTAPGGRGIGRNALLRLLPEMPIINANWQRSLAMATRPAAEKAFQSVESVLGGKDVLGVKPHSLLDWVGMIREGIPTAAIESVLRAVHVSQSELAQALGIPERTLARRKREGVLNSEESSKLLR